MNKVITDGLVLMPPPFVNGLNVWSSGDGTPGSDTYAVSGTGAFVPADQDFAGCLEIAKTQSVTKLRYMGETTILPGLYLRVTARVKAVSGPLPSVRIAGWAGGAGGAAVPGLTGFGPATALTDYGQVVEVSAIIGTGNRTGVDMVWRNALYGHFGLDLTGTNGGVVRVDDIVIEDVTSVYLRDLLGLVDVRDYGAIGDGVTDDSAAFEAADSDARGREVLVSNGTYWLGGNVTIQNQIRFEGTVTMPAVSKLILQKNFDFATYLDAFGNEELAFKKAFQALLNFNDHDSLDLGGRRIDISAPIDMQAAEGTRTTFASRRVIRNGQIQPVAGPEWAPTEVTSAGTYSTASSKTLTNVANIANIPVGSRVSGNGVGREVYVTAVNIAQQRLTLSNPLFGAAGTQVYTFTRYKYLLDFSGFEQLSQFIISDVDLNCNGIASGIMLAKSGIIFHVRDCFINKPRDRGITSIGEGCQGMLVDRCQFISNELDLPVQQRTSIGFNTNANDLKLRDNRVIRFKHFCVIGGSGSVITGNHWFHGDNEPNGVREGGIIIAQSNCRTIITGNYIDNNFIEWTNEYDADPNMTGGYSFGGLSITGNTFMCSDTADWFNWIVVKPFGSGHYLHGFSVVSNVFKSTVGNIDRIEFVDTTYADLDYGRMRTVTFEGNHFTAVNEPVYNPVVIAHTQASVATDWIVDSGNFLPFKGRVRNVDAVMPAGRISNTNNVAVYEQPFAVPGIGTGGRQARIVFGTAVKGAIRVTIRVDNPT